MSLANIPEDIRNEFIVDADGKVFAKSLRAVARLAGVSPSVLTENRLNSDGTQRGLCNKLVIAGDLPKTLQPIAGMDLRVIAKIPDFAVGCIINYFAWEAPTQSEQAKNLSSALIGMTIRSWFQKELGWEPKPISLMSHIEALRAYADVLEEKEKLETKHPGLKLLTSGTPEIEGLPPSFTIREWLDYKNYPATTQQCKNFGKLVANTKRALMQVKYHTDIQPDTRQYVYDDLDMIGASWSSFTEYSEY